MKSVFIKLILLMLISLTLFVGCKQVSDAQRLRDDTSSSSDLTVQKAQRALDTWIKDGQLTVQGVQELPQENAAKVDFMVQRLEWNEQYIGKKSYQGPGTAVFTHYSDGRWVLTNVRMTNDLLAQWNTNITVE